MNVRGRRDRLSGHHLPVSLMSHYAANRGGISEPVICRHLILKSLVR